MERQGKRLQLFIQVNTGEEPQKAGVTPKETPALLRLCREDLKLEIAGLMCIPPHDEEAGVHFAFLAKLAGELGLAGAQHGHERRLRDGRRLRRNACAGRLTDFRNANAASFALTRHLDGPGVALGRGVHSRSGRTDSVPQLAARTAFSLGCLRSHSPAPRLVLTSPEVIRAILSLRAGALSRSRDHGRWEQDR